MKKLITLIAVFLLFTMNAQDFKYGITGNFHKGSIVGVHDVSKGSYGGGLGFLAQIPLVENDIFDSAWLYLQGQLEYSMQGEFAEVNTDLYGKQKYFHDYVAFQVYLKYFFHKGNMKRDVYVFAGPRIEYLVRQEKKVSPQYDIDYFKYNQDDVVNKFGYGASFGIGMAVSHQMEVFMRYDWGFSKVYPNNKSHFTYNRLLGIGINYYLNENWW